MTTRALMSKPGGRGTPRSSLLTVPPLRRRWKKKENADEQRASAREREREREQEKGGGRRIGNPSRRHVTGPNIRREVERLHQVRVRKQKATAEGRTGSSCWQSLGVTLAVFSCPIESLIGRPSPQSDEALNRCTRNPSHLSTVDPVGHEGEVLFCSALPWGCLAEPVGSTRTTPPWS